MTIRIQRVLLPTDFSQYSSIAAKYACELATRFDAELHVLHCLELHPSLTPDFGMGLVLPKYVSESRAAAEKLLAQAVDPQWSPGRKIIRTVVEGSPRMEIVRYAREHDIDLLVLSTHGRTGLPHVILGSVAENLVRT